MSQILTPWQCASEIADWLKEQIKSSSEYSNLLDVTTGNIKIYPGFLPYVSDKKTKKTLCPAVVIRPTTISDLETESTASMAVLVTTYDDDMINGCQSLYKLMEAVRELLLVNNPINMRWEITAVLILIANN